MADTVVLKISPAIFTDMMARAWGWTEWWRNTVDDVNTAELIESARALTFRDNPGPGTWYYWARLVSVAGVPGDFAAVAELTVPDHLPLWAEASGTTPDRVIEIKVLDGEDIITIIGKSV